MENLLSSRENKGSNESLNPATPLSRQPLDHRLLLAEDVNGRLWVFRVNRTVLPEFTPFFLGSALKFQE
jgi:hypothetical protein